MDFACYPGIAVNTAAGQAESFGKIHLRADGLAFHTEPDEIQCVFPWNRVQLTCIQSKQLLLTDPEQPAWEIYTADDRLLTHPLLQHNPHTRKQVREIRTSRETQRRLKLTLLFLSALAILVLAAWGLSGLAVNILANLVPLEWEKPLAEKALHDLRRSSQIVQKPDWPEGINEVVTRLSQAPPTQRRRFELLLLEDPAPNALALPGGTILVTRGLLAFVESPEELAAVLAHEMAHVNRRHGLKMLISVIGPYYALKLFIGNRDAFAQTLGAHTTLLVAGTYSRAYEFEADALGWQRLVAANLDPRGFISVLQRADEEEKNNLFAKVLRKAARAGPSSSPYQSHPETAQRIARLQKLWDQLPKKTGFSELPRVPWKPEMPTNFNNVTGHLNQ